MISKAPKISKYSYVALRIILKVSFKIKRIHKNEFINNKTKAY